MGVGICLAAVWLMFCLRSSSAPAAGPFVAELADGERLVAEGPIDWSRTALSSDGRPLLDAERPVVSILDVRAGDVRAPEAYLEFVGGDILPARIVFGFGASDGAKQSSSEPVARSQHLLVELDAARAGSREQTDRRLRIDTSFLRRVVFAEGPRRSSPPGTLLSRDRRRTEFRNLRWESERLTLLTDAGIEHLPYEDILEVCLPARDPWRSRERQLAILAPRLDARLLRIESREGFVLTVSESTFVPDAEREEKRRPVRCQLFQPAWCESALWLPLDSIRRWEFLAADEFHLASLQPSSVAQTSILGASWRHRRNRSVRGQALRLGTDEFARGFGVHGDSALLFHLPPSAREFRVRYGLDPSVRRGGCARASVIAKLGGEVQRLHESPHLIGASARGDSGWLELPGSGQPLALELLTDSAHEGRPEGADPLDILDHVNWIDPVVRLDRDRLAESLRADAASLPAAWQSWTLSPPESHGVRVDWSFPRAAATARRFFRRVSSKTGSYTLRRRVDPLEVGDWLEVLAHAEGPGPSGEPGAAEETGASQQEEPGRGALAPVQNGVQLEIAVDGDVLSVLPVEVWDGDGEQPVSSCSLSQFRGRSVEVSLRVIGAPGGARLTWQEISFRPRPSGLLAVFDGRPTSLEMLSVRGLARVDRDVSPSHRGALVLSGSIGSPNWPGLNVPIRERPERGEYRFLQLVWRRPTRTSVGLRVARRGTTDDAADLQWSAWEGGSAEDLFEGAKSLGHSSSEVWHRTVLDLADEAGEFDFGGLELHVTPGRSAWFDGIWLARSLQDLELVAMEPLLAVGAARRARERAQVHETAANPLRAPEYVQRVADGFRLGRPEATAVEYHGEWRGRSGVLETRPLSEDGETRFERRCRVPSSRDARLALSVSHHFRGSWRLEVLVEGRSVLVRDVDGRSTASGWVDAVVPLAAWAGEEVTVSVVAGARGQAWPSAYWWFVDLGVD